MRGGSVAERNTRRPFAVRLSLFFRGARFSRHSWAIASMPLRPSIASTATRIRICGAIWITPAPTSSGSIRQGPAPPHISTGRASCRVTASAGEELKAMTAGEGLEALTVGELQKHFVGRCVFFCAISDGAPQGLPYIESVSRHRWP